MSKSNTDDGDDPIRLKGTQREIRTAYFDHETGLFTFNCVPGAGKSVVAEDIAAVDLLRRFVAGDPTPEQHVAVISFNRDEAAAIIPGMCDRLRTIVEHNLVPEAAEVTDDELEYVIQRVRRAPYVGTIDSLLRGVLVQITADVGFEELPTIGNQAQLKRVNTACYEALRADPELATRLDRLEAAYPDGKYDDSVAELLEHAVKYCRDQQLTTAAFRTELERTHESVYPDGHPETFDDIVTAVKRRVDNDERLENQVRQAIDDADRDRLVQADKKLHNTWRDCIADFCVVLAAYRETYRTEIRDNGVVSHTDVAFLVAEYFETTGDTSTTVFDDADDKHRDRILHTYRSRLQSVIIDEAQDVSTIQHAALSHFITSETRVCAVGDTLQSIYRWRHADPSLFETATTTGTYLGVDWDTHENRTATTTYRSVPAIATAINTISEPIFTDPSRGTLGTLNTEYTPLKAARDSNDETAVHIASFDGAGKPGSPQWVNPDTNVGEANQLATLLSRGLADGTFTNNDGTPLGITVLFRKRRRMSEYEAAFTDENLSVQNASDPLFDSPAVSTVFDICDWLTQPAAPEQTKTLLTDSQLNLNALTPTFAEHEYRLNSVLADETLTETQRETLTGLQRLRDQRDTSAMQPAGQYIEDIIETLALRADPNNHFTATNPTQRVANLDALTETLTQWVGTNQYSLSELITLVEPFRNTPSDGPVQPSTTGTNHDVTFQTIHRAKGDQDDVIVIADPGFNLWAPGPQNQRLITHGPIAALAPPENLDLPRDITIPPFNGGLFTPAEPWERDAGVRWASASWADSITDTAPKDRLVGTDRLCHVAKNERAEAWRLLFVALTRARNHLVLPLPQSTTALDQPRNRWLDTLKTELAYDGTLDSYTLPAPHTDPNPTNTITIGVNDIDFFAQRTAVSDDPSHARVATTPPRRDSLNPWLPRFIRPSTMYLLTDDLDKYLLAHLLGDSLHTETNNVPDDIPLLFDQLGPGEVGVVLHNVLTELVARDLPEHSLQPPDDNVRRVFNDNVTEIAPGISTDEHTELWTFFTSVLTEFLDSTLWKRIQDPETRVTVEQPIDGLVTIDPIEIEIHGQADFVIETPTGNRYVTDVKIALTNPTPETRRRYELQVAAYAYLFDNDTTSPSTTHRTIETLGVSRGTHSPELPPEIVSRRLAALLNK